RLRGRRELGPQPAETSTMSPGAPTPRTSWLRMTFMTGLLSDGVGKQGHLPGVLDGGGDVALMLGAVAGDPAGADLAPVAHELAQQVDVLVVDVVLLLGAELTELALGLALEGALGHTDTAFRGPLAALLERRLVVELTTLAGPGVAARPVAAAARAAPAGALDLGGGELEAGTDLVGLHLGDGALLALGGFPGAGPEPADHDAAGALLEGLGRVLGLLAPDVDPEERGLPVLPGVALTDPGGDGQPEVGHRRPVGGEAQLGVVGQVADEHHLVVVCHCGVPPLASRAGSFGRSATSTTASTSAERPRSGPAGKETPVRRPRAGGPCAGSHCVTG